MNWSIMLHVAICHKKIGRDLILNVDTQHQKKKKMAKQLEYSNGQIVQDDWCSHVTK